MPETFNPETKHETSDVSVRALLWFVVIFVAFAVVVHVLLYGLFKVYVWQAKNEPHPARTAMKTAPPIPENPRLQPFPSKDAKGTDVAPTSATPVVDMAEMRQKENEALTTPGWLDKEHGRVRIPIESAKQLVLQRGVLKVVQ
jgi:hypothetical protein